MTVIRADVSSFASTLQRADAPARTPAQIDIARGDGVQGPSGSDFADRVQEVLGAVNHSQVQAREAAEAYASGERNDLHGTMITLEQADISFRLVSNLRSRLVEAYREVMRMGS